MNMKKRAGTSLLLFILWFSSASPMLRPSDPKADSNATVQRDDVRFTVLTPQLIRMEWSRDKAFEDRASLVFIQRRLPVPSFSVDERSGWLVIATQCLTLRYQLLSGPFSEDNLSISFELGGKPVIWKPGMTDPLNLKGTTRTLDGTNGEKDVTLEDGILSRSGWALVDDSERPLFDGASDWNWAAERPDGKRQDWYFFGYGHDYKKALYDFTRVAGQIPMPPKFAFGYWWSRYWTYSEDELRALIADMKSYDVPIDVLIVDMDWHETFGLSSWSTKRDPFGQSIGWTGYTWNRSLFPDPDRFLAWTESQNLKTALNLHPASGIAPMEEKYDAFAAAYGFPASSRPYIPFAIEDKKWTETYFDIILHPLEKQGVDFWWLDWQAWLQNKHLKGLSNTWWLNYTFYTDMVRQGRSRPILFHRWGGLGNHRFQIGFSGDTHITWESLTYQPYFTATAGNVGYGYWSHDIGGHMAGEPTPEKYLRWFQFGIFSPIVRTHATKSAAIERRIWKYSDCFEMMHDALHLRYALFPYIYTAARQAYDSGISLCRPMYYEYPEKEEAYTFRGQYFFGNDMLVAPVVAEASETTRLALQKIWLPQGDWYEWFSGTTLQGDVVIERSYTLEEIPLFVRAGSIIPMAPKRSCLQTRIDTLALAVVPGPDSETQVYEDDGTTSQYQNGHCAWTRMTKETTEDGTVRIEVYPRLGEVPALSDTRAIEIRLPGTFPPSEVRVDGKPYPASDEGKTGSWWYDAGRLTTHLLTPMRSCQDKVEAIVIWSSKARSNGHLLNGKIGLLARLPNIVQMMKDVVNREDQIANAPSLVLKAGSLPVRIRYQPEKTVDFLDEFDREFPDLVREIMEYPRGDRRMLENIVVQFPGISSITR